MAPIDHLILFISTYSNVFLLGFNSKNVHQSRYVAAFFTSIGITIAQFFFVKYAVSGNGLLFLTISGLGGALGITSAIWVHDNMGKLKKVKKNVVDS